MSTLIESTAIIEQGAKIGNGCYIGHYTVIRRGVVIGNRSHVRAHCFIAAGAKIGNDTQVMQFSNICRGCIIEDEVFVGMGCMTTNTRKIAYRRSYKDIAEPPIIRRAARIGARVTILPGVEIGQNCVIGAGSVVTKSTEPGYIYVGNPAKILYLVPEDEFI
jgi:UDP-2-acetamido-3-amino-2,3-dideoxy-glucuronate N-acetyltransferase